VVEGFVWSKLTSGSLVQILWILLLPFTFFNVANWMYPRATEGAEPRGRREVMRRASRLVMFLLGLGLTASYVLWEFELVVRQLFYDATWSTPTIRFAAGAVASGLLGVTVVLVAWRTRTDFEKVRTPQALEEHLDEPAPSGLGFSLRDRETFADARFWMHAGDSQRLLRWHLLAGIGVLATATFWALPHVLGSADPVPDGLQLAPLFLWLGLTEVGLFVVLLLTYVVGCGLGGAGFRILPPVVVGIMAFGLATGAFSGLGSVIRSRVNAIGTPDFDLSAAFGVGAVVFIASFILWLVPRVVSRRRHEMAEMVRTCLPPITPPRPGAEQEGVTKFMRGKLATVRALAPTIGDVDIPVTITSLAFLATAASILAFDLVKHGRPPGGLGFMASLGAWMVKTTVGAAIPFLVYRAFNPSARAKVAILWDTLTFFPRRYHPFAVRPYAERAVPELEDRIYRHVKEGRRVVLAVHSQGTVLAFAALEQLAAWKPAVTRETALVTFGCPLAQMHARFFPQLFSRDQFVRLRDGQLFGPPDRPEIAWRNFSRRTDYIGQRVFTGPGSDAFEEELPDPPEEPSRADLPWKPVEVPPDPAQPVWTKLMVHSYYNNATRLRAWVDETVRQALEASDAGVKGGED